MKVDLTGKVVLIMGVGDGIGRSVVERFTECGANVGIMRRETDEWIKIETAINARPGGNLFVIPGDTFNSDDLANAVWQTVEVFGALHLAINNTDIVKDFQHYLSALKALS